MQRNVKLAICAVFATLAVASAVRADGTATPTPAPAPANNPAPPPAQSSPMPTASGQFNRFGWAGIGFYDVSVSACADTEIGNICESASTGAFGINVGAALSVYSFAPGFNVDVWGNVAAAFGSDSFFPITVGGAVSYDKLPVLLFGGLGFSVVPNSANTSLGLDIMLMGVYPLPMVMKNFGGQVQLQYEILNNSLSIFSFTVGATLGF